MIHEQWFTCNGVFAMVIISCDMPLENQGHYDMNNDSPFKTEDTSVNILNMLILLFQPIVRISGLQLLQVDQDCVIGAFDRYADA